MEEARGLRPVTQEEEMIAFPPVGLSQVHPGDAGAIEGSQIAAVTNGRKRKIKQRRKRRNPRFSFFATTFPMFAGYAVLFAFQKKLKNVLNVLDDGSFDSYAFGIGVSCLYIGNLVFRMGHNLIFAWCSSWYRVLISMISMSSSMFGIFLLFNGLLPAPLIFVYVAYSLGGLGIGTYEANVLSVATSFAGAKFWAIIAIPCGINFITIVGFLLIDLSVPVEWIVFVVFLLCVTGFFFFFLSVPTRKSMKSANTFRVFLSNWKKRRLVQWFPFVWLPAVCMAFNMFTVSLFSPGFVLYLYPAPERVHFKILHFVSMKNSMYFAIYDCFFFLGDSLGRFIFQRVRILPPFAFTVLNVLGLCFGFSTIPDITFLAAALVSLGNGGLYAQTCRRIDAKMKKEFNLVSFSTWLFVGDIGSTIGSNMIALLISIFDK